MRGAVRVHVVGHALDLLPERAIFWENAGTLLVADTHWGKAATFRAAGLPVPGGTTLLGLSRLDFLLDALPVRRVLFLGDFLHAREGRTPGTLASLLAWRLRRPSLDLVLIRGNHDRHAGDPPPDLGILALDPPYSEDGLAFSHHPVSMPGAFVLAGHIHPAVRLVGRARQRQRAACFWFRPDSVILPAFGEFTGAGIIQPGLEDRVFVVAGSSVLEVA